MAAKMYIVTLDDKQFLIRSMGPHWAKSQVVQHLQKTSRLLARDGHAAFDRATATVTDIEVVPAKNDISEAI